MSRPNFLLFMTDQQRADSIGSFGNSAARTPNIDALASRGTRFTNAYSQHSACSQSRASMMTGWYPHVAGHRSLDNLLKPWEPNLLATLRRAGYFVAWPGIRGDTFSEGGTAASTDFFGFTVQPSLAAIAAPYAAPLPEDHHYHHAHYVGRLDGASLLTSDEAAIRTAIELIRDGMPEPWCLYLTLLSPHTPFAVEEPWFSLHDRRDMPPPVLAYSGKPEFMTELRARSNLDRLDTDDWAEIAATYYGMVSRLDEQFGRVIQALEATNAADRTATFFFTDHGEYLGDYGIVEKWPSGLDRCLVQNPLIVAGPHVTEGAVCEGLVEMIDLVPTICELGGTDVGHVHFGQSLTGLLKDSSVLHRHLAFSEGGFRIDEESQNEYADFHPYALKAGLQHERPELVGRAAAVRSAEWTYVHRLYEQDELYDRVSDPSEAINLLSSGGYGEVAGQMQSAMFDWMLATSDVMPLDRDPRIDPDLSKQISV